MRKYRIFNSGIGNPDKMNECVESVENIVMNFMVIQNHVLSIIYGRKSTVRKDEE